MGDILQNWIQARLGILIDLGPKVFGHYTKDGKLLAQILVSYDIISGDQLQTIISTHDPALCRVNLKHLSHWLRYLGVELDDENVDEISCGNGTASLRLFYKVYLCLETKDRLHFITLQKEREKFVPTSRKFEVSTVCEDPPPYEPPEHPRAKKLLAGKALVDGWQRPKFPAILRQLKKEREKLEVAAWEPYPVVRPVEYCIPESSEWAKGKEEEESLEADRFARKMSARTRRIEDEIEKTEERERAFATGLEKVADDPEMARAYIEWLKCRRKRSTAVSALNSKMQKMLLHQLWERLSWEQENLFDEAIARRSLDQSKYEKQMMTKLCEVRDQRHAMLDNQKILEDMTEKANEVEHLASFEREKDVASKTQRDAETECQRMCELRQRLVEEKISKIRERHQLLCRETVQDIVDLALKIEDYRQLNDGVVPQTILREWIAKFVKGEPILDPLLHDPIDANVNEFVLEEASRAKLEQIELLREALLEDYLEMKPPWDLFSTVSGRVETEVMKLGRMVLGYVVHRLLNYVDNRVSDSKLVSPPPTVNCENVAIILGITNPAVHETLRALLDRLEIRLVRMEDAINYCLDQYKNELLDVEEIDKKIVDATNQFVKDIESGKHRISGLRFRVHSASTKSAEVVERKGRSRSSMLSKRERHSSDATSTAEKQTQTPRNLPRDDIDPVLTDAACLGKWAYEFLTLGQPITNDLSIHMLMEYLQTLTDAKGWALIDYPTTYEQMSLLETTMTGFKIPPDPEVLEFEDVTIEDVQSLSPRIVYDSGKEPVDTYRQSRLVPTPIKRIQDIPTPTFAKLFVRVMQKPTNYQIQDRSFETVPRSAHSVDKFYASRKIGYFLYYSNLDETTLKKLARLVIGEPLQSKTSVELFGEVHKGHEKATSRSTGSKAPVVRRMVPEIEEPADSEIDFDIEMDREEEMLAGIDEGGHEYEVAEARPTRPGESSWQWVDLPLPSSGFVQVLASLWESMEETYLADLKELLFLKSVHTSGVVPYKSFLERNASEFVKRPDNKQDLLHEFHLAFNEIDEDARHDSDVKCEMHRRLADFQAVLWDVCDKRRQEAEQERERLIGDDWTFYEAVVLYNVYIGILQAELDRCVDTMLMLLDYYAGMAGKPLLDARLPKVDLIRAQVDDEQSVPVEGKQPSPPIEAKPASKKGEGDTKRSKNRGESTKSSAVVPLRFVPPTLDQDRLRQQIRELLTDTSQEVSEIRTMEVVRAMESNVRFTRSVVDEIAVMVDALIEKQDRDRDSKNVVGRDQDLSLEQRYAVDYEIDRIRLMLHAIEAAARSEFAFLLDTIRRTFHLIHDEILDRYWREMKSVNDAATVFCFSIEEGRYLEREMLLDGDHFIIRSNVFVMKVPSKKPEPVKEVETDTRFRIAQLSRLMDMFRRVAPHGTMPEKAFVLILQDLVGHGPEEGETMLLPCCWYRLRPVEICAVVRRLFECANYVDWREFVIYAMELPTPSHREILIARDRFRVQDPDLKEVVTIDQFFWTPLWFLECTESPSRVFELLGDKFLRNPENLYQEEMYRLELDTYDAANPRQESETRIEANCLLTEENLRLILAKELLGRMYMVGRRTVNYTMLLLAFCKDEDPREGFAKALALAMGSRICTDVQEGERYVEDLYKRTHFELSEASESDSTAEQRIVEEVLKEDDEAQKRRSVHKELTFEDLLGESLFGESDYRFRGSDQESIEYWVPFDVCLTVLCASLPVIVFNTELLGEHDNLRDALTSVYNELKDNVLEEQEDVVLAHRLLNHRFMRQLLNCTSKFTDKCMGRIVQEVLRARKST